MTVLAVFSGKFKGGLSKGGLGPKGANSAQKGPFGAISALPPRLWGAEDLVPIGPEKAPIGPEKVPICPEKARFRRKDFPQIFSENLGLKPPFVSPPLDFPNKFRGSGDSVESSFFFFFALLLRVLQTIGQRGSRDGHGGLGRDG